jgi:CubicO group peptidase (beta-lactamase class C family)
VLQHISGTDHQGLEALFQSRVAEPIGLANTQIVPDEMLAARLVSPHEDGNLIDPDPVDARSKFGAAFGVHTNATDMANWLVYLMNDTGLDPSTLDAFLAPQGTKVPAVDGNPLVLDTDYALGFSTIDTPLGRLHVHDGNNRGYSSALIMHREAGWGVAVLSNEDQSSALAMDLTLRLHQSLLQQ